MRKLILFDVDGTIAESSKKADDAILVQLGMMKDKDIQYGLISGGTYNKIKSQVGMRHIESNNPLFNYIFSENGMIGYHCGKKFFEKNLSMLYSDEKIYEIEKYILNNSKNFIKNYDSTKEIILERRNSMWYFSPYGVYCDDKNRKEFMKKDNEDKIRINIIKNLSKTLKDKYNLTIKLGGNIGLAIHPIGWDKSYIINHNILDIKLWKH